MWEETFKSHADSKPNGKHQFSKLKKTYGILNLKYFRKIKRS